jgi:hypothetical protein
MKAWKACHSAWLKWGFECESADGIAGLERVGATRLRELIRRKAGEEFYASARDEDANKGADMVGE